MRRWDKGRRVERERFDHGAPIAKIDTRPMVFVVMFVVLVFLIPAKAPVHVFQIDLPFALEGIPPDYQFPPFVTVELDDKGVVLLEDEAVALNTLGQKLQALSPEHTLVLFRASANSAYDRVLKTLGEIRSAGVAANDICFDIWQLQEHRQFERIAFQPVTTPMPNDDPPVPHSMEIGGCQQFFPPIPTYI